MTGHWPIGGGSGGAYPKFETGAQLPHFGAENDEATLPVASVTLVSLAAVFSIVTQLSSPQTLRDDTKNGC